MSDFQAMFLEETADMLAAWERACLELEGGYSESALEDLARQAHSLKSTAMAVGFDDLSAFVHHVEESMQALRQGQLARDALAIQSMLAAHAVVTEWVAALKREPGTKPPVSAPAWQAPRAPRTVVAPTPAAAPAAPPSPTPAAPPTAAAPPPDAPTTLRVASERLDQIVRLVGELSTQQSIVWQGREAGRLGTAGCDNAIQLMQKILRDLQASAMTLRLQPLHGLFQRLERAARDVARTQDKRITVRLTGEAVELDRNVTDKISDALVHLVRNCVDHGLEGEADRRRAQKPDAGTLVISAEQRLGDIVITIADDGRGMDHAAIKRKAVKLGLLSETDQPSVSELEQLVFRSGFSTAAAVTDVSGRGVGMDVVKTSVDGLGGAIAISSTPGRGTVFTIRLPSTLALTESLVVETAGCAYAVPLIDVAEIVDLATVACQTLGGGASAFAHRGRIVPLVHLNQRLPPELAGRPAAKAGEALAPALLVAHDGLMTAFAVDRIVGQSLIYVRPLEPALAAMPGLDGGTILGNGEPSVVLGLRTLARAAWADGSVGVARAAAEADVMDEDAGTEAPRFVVFRVDDRHFATPIEGVREVARQSFTALSLPSPTDGNAPVGLAELRGMALPVVSARAALSAPRRVEDYLLVLDHPGRECALAVDAVEGVGVRLERTLHATADAAFPVAFPWRVIGSAQYGGKPVVIVDPSLRSA